jgi:hypothetical protein
VSGACLGFPARCSAISWGLSGGSGGPPELFWLVCDLKGGRGVAGCERARPAGALDGGHGEVDGPPLSDGRTGEGDLVVFLWFW